MDSVIIVLMGLGGFALALFGFMMFIGRDRPQETLDPDDSKHWTTSETRKASTRRPTPRDNSFSRAREAYAAQHRQSQPYSGYVRSKPSVDTDDQQSTYVSAIVANDYDEPIRSSHSDHNSHSHSVYDGGSSHSNHSHSGYDSSSHSSYSSSCDSSYSSSSDSSYSCSSDSSSSSSW